MRWELKNSMTKAFQKSQTLEQIIKNIPRAKSKKRFFRIPKAKNQERLKKFTKVNSKLNEMRWSHLFQIDETSPVNIPCKQKNFWSPDQYGWDNLFLFPYKHPLSVQFSGEETTFTDCLTKVSPLNRETTLLEITKEPIILK